MKDNLKSVIKKKTELTETGAKGGFKTTDEIDTYKEYGTGIVGISNPHLSEVLSKIGWKYDVNEHGEKGWVYPKKDGGFGWTKGISAQKKFYLACKRVEEKFNDVVVEEISKIIGGM